MLVEFIRRGISVLLAFFNQGQRVNVGLDPLVEDVQMGVISALPLTAGVALHVGGITFVAFFANYLA